MRSRVKQGWRSGRWCAIVALVVCVALAACSETKLYAPVGSIQKRLHDLDLMCRAYLFESGTFTLSEDFAAYAPQIAKFCAIEARRLDKICSNPGAGFNERDIETLEVAANALGELSVAIEEAMEVVDLADPYSRTTYSLKFEYAALSIVVKFIEKRHLSSGGSDALFK